MREPSAGDVVAIPLPDGDIGVGQAIGRGLFAMFETKSSRIPDAQVVCGLRVAYRSFVNATYRTDDRWIRVGNAPIRAELTNPFVYWHCASDYRGYLAEWRIDEPTRDLGLVSMDGAVGASVPSVLPITAELWLFRLLEGISFSPWWSFETNGVRIPWAPERPSNYLPSWGVRIHPESIDAPAREKLDRVWSVAFNNPDRRPRALVEVLESSLDFVRDLYGMPSSDWARPLRAALEASPEGSALTIDECGRALAAAFAIALAAGAEVEQGRVPDLVVRVSRKAVKPSSVRTLAPAAGRSLDRVLDRSSPMWSVVSRDRDRETLVASLRKLREWFDERA